MYNSAGTVKYWAIKLLFTPQPEKVEIYRSAVEKIIIDNSNPSAPSCLFAYPPLDLVNNATIALPGMAFQFTRRLWRLCFIKTNDISLYSLQYLRLIATSPVLPPGTALR